MSIPSDPAKRKRLILMIDNAAKEKLIIDSANVHLQDLRKAAKEEFEMPAKEFNNLVKAWIDETYIEELVHEVQDFFDNYNLLKGVDNSGD
jgi:hypothetical protein